MRRTPALRGLAAETELRPEHLIAPMFVAHGEGRRDPIGAMPGVCRYSVDTLVTEIGELKMLGIPAVMLFGIPAHKDAVGSENYDPDGIVQRAIRAIKARYPDFVVITDVCMCEYTAHGHCGIVRGEEVDNDATLDVLARAAVSHADAGADLVAPSAMADGMVGAIRAALDREGFIDTGIMSYAVKFASAFYGPFREAADSAPQFGDRRAYQMPVGNAREALREAALDAAEGADFLMVKPGMAYLDVLHRVREQFNLPLAVYNVSGEYSMVKAAAQHGWIDERRVVLETLIGMRRAGADVILTYHAKDAACWLREN